MSNEITLSKKFESKNNEVRAYYLEKLETDRNLAIKINQLVEIVHQEHKDWSLNKIAQYIVSVNEDLDGFSKSSIYERVNEENRILLGTNEKPTSKENRTKLQNNVTEPSFPALETNVIEDSSSSATTKTLTTAYDVKDAETVIEDGIVVDNEDNDEDTERTWQFTYVLEVKGQEIPVIVTVYPDTATGKVELDEKAARRLNKRK